MIRGSLLSCVAVSILIGAIAAAQPTPRPVITRVFTLENADANVVVKTLDQMKSADAPPPVANAAKHEVTAFEQYDVLRRMEEVVAKLDEPRVPFEDDFPGDVLRPDWQVDVSDGAAIKVANGALQIKARQNTFAHIQRRLDEDLIRASATITPDRPISWAPAVFLYWNPANWCQLAVIERAGGMVFAAEMIDGKYIEHELSKVPFAGAHEIGIELAVDAIRYVTRDADAWKTESVQQRPEQFRPAPALLVIGKGFGGAAGFPAPDLNNNYKDLGEQMSSQIGKVRVERLPIERAMETRQEREQRTANLRDVAGEEELANETDPTFDSVARHFPPLKLSREVIGVKDHPNAIGVAADGALQLNDAIAKPEAPIAFFEIGQPAYRFGTGSALPTKRLLNGYMPVVIAVDQRGPLKLEQTAFGYSDGMSTSMPLQACVRLAIKSDEPTKTIVRYVAQANRKKTTLKEWKVDVAAGTTSTVEYRLAYDYAKTAAAELRPGEFDEKLFMVTEWWEQAANVAMRFFVPEQRVQDAYRAWLCYNFLNTRQRGAVREICDGSGFYGVIYGYSAALYCYVLDMLGYNDLAREYLDEMLTLQQPDGLWYLNFGHTDTGTVMKVIAEHYRITRDADWLRKTAPRVLAMYKWIAEHRKESMHSVHGRRSPVHGLIRFRPYCDYEMPAFDYYPDAYLCIGLENMADVLREIGMNDESAKLATEARAYRSDILASMDASIITHDGQRMLPLFPENHFLLKESNYSANGYYGLVSSCLLETNFLPRDDARTQLLVDMLQKRGGLTAGVCRFFDQIDHAYAYGYWNTCMNRDEVKPVILGLYGSMAYGMSRGTYAAVECTTIKTGENAHTLPHTYSNTVQLRLLRNMLVREDGDKLLLAHFTPRQWLEPGKSIRVEDAPTSFGKVSYSIESKADGGVIVKLTPPAANPPAEVRIRVRHPGGKDIKTSEFRGGARPENTIEKDVLVLKKVSEPVTIALGY